MRIGLEKKKKEQNDGAYKRQTWFHLLVIRFIFAIIYQLVTGVEWRGNTAKVSFILAVWNVYRVSSGALSPTNSCKNTENFTSLLL